MKRPVWPPVVALLSVAGCGGDDSGGTQDTEAMADSGRSDERPPPPEGCGDGVYEGSIYLERGPSELDKLDGIGTVVGHVVVDKTDVASLDGLQCIVEIGGDLHVFGNQSLTDLSGLDNLWAVDGNVIIAENHAITDFDGLRGLTFVGTRAVPTSIVVRNMDSMTGISGLSALRELHGDLYIQFNQLLRHMDGMRGLELVDGLFAVTHNPQLCISSINAVGEGLSASPEPGSSTLANDDSC